jgi:signal transduction histidine kinase
MNRHTSKSKMDDTQIVEHFINSCSHDLRAPLASIRGLVKLADYYPQHEEVSRCLRMIDSCTDTMDKLIRSLEEFMVIKHYSVIPEEVNCDVLLDDILHGFHNEAGEMAIQLNRQIKASKPLFGDRFIFTLIFKHLIKNAITFQDAGKKNKFVDIKVESNKKLTRLQVIDNGIGIPPQYNREIFKPFFRASTQSKGVGMGLFLLSNLAEKINATVNFRSDEHIGSSFTVLIPA